MLELWAQLSIQILPQILCCHALRKEVRALRAAGFIAGRRYFVSGVAADLLFLFV